MRMFSISQLYPSDRPMNPKTSILAGESICFPMFSQVIYVVLGFRKYLKSDPILTHDFSVCQMFRLPVPGFSGRVSKRQACHIPSTTAARALSSTWTAMPWAPRWGFFTGISCFFKRILRGFDHEFNGFMVSSIISEWNCFPESNILSSTACQAGA